ncbi:MAG TPA: gamma-glutamyltransferase [Polyangiaceae bacterium]
MRKWLLRIGIGVGSLLLVLGCFAWYIKDLPWRNRCGDPPVAAPSRGVATNSAIATSQTLATRAAADVLTDGGNAADAAIAAALMLSVVEPGNSGLGGGGFALIHDPMAEADVMLDFRERAPIDLDVEELRSKVRANPDALRSGAFAVAVPAEWQGLVELHRRFAWCSCSM